MKKFIYWLKKEESGQGMLEYALIIVLVSVASIAALLLFGPAIGNMFNKATNNLTE